MLVLSRRTDETIVIGHDINVTVLRIHGNRVKLGITCNRDIPVLRTEIANRREESPEKETSHASNACPPSRGIEPQLEFHML